MLVTLLFATAGMLAVDLQPSAAPRAARVTAREESRRGHAVRRSRSRSSATAGSSVSSGSCPEGVSPERQALRELLRGPTRVERARGLRSGFRPGAVRLRSVLARGELWLVSFSRSLLGSGHGGDEADAGSRRSARRSHASGSQPFAVSRRKAAW